MRFSLLALLLLLLSVSAHAEEQAVRHKCLVIYSLNGQAQSFFSQQVKQLETQLLRQDIALVDLNSWSANSPYLTFSGRQKSLFRKSYDLSPQGNAAVLLDNKGQLIVRLQGAVDLVDLMLACH